MTIHDVALLDHPEWFAPRFVQLYRWLWPRLAKRARIATVSTFSQERIAEHLGLPPGDISVVPNGVSDNFRPASPEAILQARRRFSLDEGAYFVTLSTLEPRKNLDLVFRAWRHGGFAQKHVRLVVLGARGSAAVFASTGVERQNLEGVIFTGRVADELLAPIISGSAALIYPSLYEGFGLPLLEGMACGAPVITTRLASMPEVGGDAALYVDPHDQTDMIDAMERLLEDNEVASSRRAASLKQASKFDWIRTAATMDAVFQTL